MNYLNGTYLLKGNTYDFFIFNFFILLFTMRSVSLLHYARKTQKYNFTACKPFILLVGTAILPLSSARFHSY